MNYWPAEEPDPRQLFEPWARTGALSDEAAAAIREIMPFGPPHKAFAREIAAQKEISYLTILNIATGASYRRRNACPSGHPLGLQLAAEATEKRRKNANRVSRSMRNQIGESQGWLCVYCETDIKKGATIDRKVPTIEYGDSGLDNLQLVCRRCKASKYNLSHEEYLEKFAWIKPYVDRAEKCQCSKLGCPLWCSGCYRCHHGESGPFKGQALCEWDDQGQKCEDPDQCRELGECIRHPFE